ncbi:MAG: Alpha-amylase [Myxococcaceae bacterium]|nr:Alpha-amylase [Myxococcaceae bacterium]
MSSVCCYFEVHQPYRVRNYDCFQIGLDHSYFDDALNGEIMRKVAQKCYLPANLAMRELIERHEGKFKVAYSITGVALEQMQQYAPEVIESFQELVATGCVELLAETYYHSLAVLYDLGEFREQVAMHGRLMKQLFGVTPTIFRNTELIYDDRIGREVHKLGYRGMLAEGADDVLGWRSPNYVYKAPDTGMALLLKNYRLSDDIAFRFSNQSWADYPLTAPKFASWVHQLGDHSDGADTINLFMDYETFGEHQWEATGIFQFLAHLPSAILERPEWTFKTPSETIESLPARDTLSFPRTVSWADAERDLTAWQGNEMQNRALDRISALGERIRRRNNPTLLALWRKLTTSDHFYYMCTKWFSDGDVHAYFSPYESPYEAFINYMNAVTDLEESVMKPTPAPAVVPPRPVLRTPAPPATSLVSNSLAEAAVSAALQGASAPGAAAANEPRGRTRARQSGAEPR